MKEQTIASFGYKWETFPIAGVDRPALAYGADRIERNGWSVEEFRDWVGGKLVLDAGCGMGWYTDYLASLNPTGEVYGIDIAGKAVKAGVDAGHPNLLVGDITALPFQDATFDYIACEEVIHHTPDPAETLAHLASKLKPGGTFTMYIYKRKPLLRELADTVIREQTTAMSIEECLAFSEQMTALGKALYEVDETIEVPDIQLLGIEAGEYTVHEFVYRHFLKCYFDWKVEDEGVSTATNFDWYHPEYAYRYDAPAVEEMVAAAGLDLDVFNELMSGFSVRATKPASE